MTETSKTTTNTGIKTDIGTNAIDAVSSVGIIYFKWKMYFAIIIGICFIISAFVLYAKNKKDIIKVNAIVTNVICNKNIDETLTCNVSVMYAYKGNKYTSAGLTNNMVLKGQALEIYINPKQPYLISFIPPSTTKLAASILLCMAFCIIIISVLFYVFAKADKGLGATLFTMNIL